MRRPVHARVQRRVLERRGYRQLIARRRRAAERAEEATLLATVRRVERVRTGRRRAQAGDRRRSAGRRAARVRKLAGVGERALAADLRGQRGRMLVDSRSPAHAVWARARARHTRSGGRRIEGSAEVEESACDGQLGFSARYARSDRRQGTVVRRVLVEGRGPGAPAHRKRKADDGLSDACVADRKVTRALTTGCSAAAVPVPRARAEAATARATARRRGRVEWARRGKASESKSLKSAQRARDAWR